MEPSCAERRRIAGQYCSHLREVNKSRSGHSQVETDVPARRKSGFPEQGMYVGPVGRKRARYIWWGYKLSVRYGIIRCPKVPLGRAPNTKAEQGASIIARCWL